MMVPTGPLLSLGDEMTEVSTLAKRIHGTVRTTGANNPIVLDDPNTLLIVEKGFLDIFVVEKKGVHISNRYPFVNRLSEGMAAFGVNAIESIDEKNESVKYYFAAIPSQEARIVFGNRQAISSDEGLGIDSIIWIDDWIAELSSFLIRFSEPPPRNAQMIEADPDVEYSAGTLIAMHHDIVWVSSDSPMKFNGHYEVFLNKDEPLLPITSQTWLSLDQRTKISAVYTPTALISGKLWSSLEAFNHRVLKHGKEVWERSGEIFQNKYITSLKSIEESQEKAFNELLTPLTGTKKQKAATRLQPSQRWSAVNLVATKIGMSLEIPQDNELNLESFDDIMSHFSSLGVRTRRLFLEPGWWKRTGTAILGFTKQDNMPVALLPGLVGGYKIYDPETQKTSPVGKKEAMELGETALMLYAPIPDQIGSGTGALTRVFKGFQKEFLLIMIITALGGIVALVAPIITGQVLANYLPRNDQYMWTSGLVALALGTISAAVFKIIAQFSILRILGLTDERLQAAILIKLLSLPTIFFRNYSVGDLADRADGISKVRETVTEAVSEALADAFASLFAVSLLFWYSWPIAIFVCFLSGIFIVTTFWISIRQIKHHREEFRLKGDINGLVYQIINGLPKLRVANSESHALAKWAALFAAQKREALGARKWAAGNLAFSGLYFPLSLMVVFLVLATISISAIGLEVAEFLSFYAALGMLLVALIGLSYACVQIASSAPYFERINPVLTVPKEKNTTNPSADPGPLRGHIEFSSVVFQYRHDLPKALDEVSFSIPEGDSVAFVGASGSGKSTILRLLIGFETPTSGAIFLDGHNLDNLNMSSVRSRMGIVMQFGYLFADSIYNNVSTYTGLSDEEAWQAIRHVGLEDEIKAMPMGMRTILSENGGGLSGGQKQRLLIARALARHPSILLMDEATSSLDNKAQAIVHNSIKTMNTTSIVIAHRLSTVRDVDQIFVLDSGKIVESGNFENLMKQNGIFTQLAQRQLVEQGDAVFT